MILDEYWAKHPELKEVPIYYASSLTKKCLSVYQTYLNMMSPTGFNNPGTSFGGGGSTFQYVTSIRGSSSSFGFNDHNHDPGSHISGLETGVGPCVVMASPGMLQSGLSRELLEAWCGDAKNGLVLTGYSVEGTLAKSLLSEPTEIVTASHHHHGSSKRSIIPFKMSVENVSFSAHVDFVENARFIEEIQPMHLVLVHGEYNEMMRLRNALQHKYDIIAEEGLPHTKIHTPRNCERLELAFGESRVARVVGSLLTEKQMADGDELDALVIVGKSFEMNVILPKDLNDYYPTLRSGAHSGGVRIKTTAPFPLIIHQIEQLVGKNHLQVKNTRLISLFNEEISVIQEQADPGTLLILWRAATPLIEMVADSIVALVIGIDSSPSSVILTTTSAHTHSTDHSDMHLESDIRLKLESNMELKNDTNSHIQLLCTLLNNYYNDAKIVQNGVEIDTGEKTTYFLTFEPELVILLTLF